MARLFGAAASSQVATGAGTNRTIFQLAAPANCGVSVSRLEVTFDGTSSTASKALVSIVKGATSGTGTNLPTNKVHGHTGSVQATAKENFSIEPSGGAVIASQVVSPIGGWSLLEEIWLNPGETLGVVVNVATSVNARVRARWEE